VEKFTHSEGYDLFLIRLRHARQEVGLTQGQLANRLGRTQSFVSKCERGERRLDIVELRTFCIVMGISFTDFVLRLACELDGD